MSNMQRLLYYEDRAKLIKDFLKGTSLHIGAYDGGFHEQIKNEKMEAIDIIPDIKRGIKEGIAEKIPYPEKYFDTVIIPNTMMAILNPLNALDEAYRVLKKNGRLIITEPNMMSLDNILRKNVAKYDMALYSWDITTMERLIKKTKFKIIKKGFLNQKILTMNIYYIFIYLFCKFIKKYSSSHFFILEK